MTEKRFTLKNERTLQDNLTGKAYVFSWKTDAEEVCRIMNMFYEENMRIKRKNQRVIQWRNNQEKEIEELIEENEELKSVLRKMANRKGEIITANGWVYYIREVITDDRKTI